MNLRFGGVDSVLTGDDLMRVLPGTDKRPNYFGEDFRSTVRYISKKKNQAIYDGQSTLLGTATGKGTSIERQSAGECCDRTEIEYTRKNANVRGFVPC
jgi:hypothetical protein